MPIWLILVILIVAALMAYVRLAPSAPGRWHVPPQVSENRKLKGGVHRIVTGTPDGLARLHTQVMETPRTQVLDGSVDSGMVTYVTRSAVFGFPDYTTAHQDGETLRVYGRLRFGRSDLGVNQNRVDQWLKRAGL